MAQHSIVQGCTVKVDVTVERVTARRLLRTCENQFCEPDNPKKTGRFDADDDPQTIHLAMKDGDEVVAIVSLLPEEKEGCPWRLRGDGS